MNFTELMDNMHVGSDEVLMKRCAYQGKLDEMLRTDSYGLAEGGSDNYPGEQAES